jgi:hypothetical protein
VDRLRVRLAAGSVGFGVVLLAVGVTVQFGWTWTAMLAGAGMVAAGLLVEVGD